MATYTLGPSGDPADSITIVPLVQPTPGIWLNGDGVWQFNYAAVTPIDTEMAWTSVAIESPYPTIPDGPYLNSLPSKPFPQSCQLYVKGVYVDGDTYEIEYDPQTKGTERQQGSDRRKTGYGAKLGSWSELTDASIESAILAFSKAARDEATDRERLPGLRRLIGAVQSEKRRRSTPSQL